MPDRAEPARYGFCAKLSPAEWAWRDWAGEAGETEPLPIECGMGTKWGFYKFPLDPAPSR